MEKIIEVYWQNKYDETITGSALIEYARYDEDGTIVNEILNVFLPERVPTYQHKHIKAQATEAFYRGEGYDV